MRWPRKVRDDRTIEDRSTRSQRLWFAAVTKDPFGVKARARRVREFERTFAELDALDEEDYF